METKKSQNKYTAEEKAAKILEALYSGNLQAPLEENIRSWFFSAADRDIKDEALYMVYDSVVTEASVTGISTVNDLEALKTQLALPVISYVDNNGKITIPTGIDDTRKQAILASKPGSMPMKRKFVIGIAAVLIPAAIIIGTATLLSNRIEEEAAPEVISQMVEEPAEEIEEVIEKVVPVPVVKNDIVFSAVADREKVELADGSSVLLYPGGTLSVPDNFPDERNVLLKGKAFFNVAENANKKFSVHTDGPTISVHGTEFLACAQDSYMSVTLHGGSLSIDANNKTTTLSEGERLEYFHATGQTNVNKVRLIDPENPALDFELATMNCIFDVMELYSGINIVRNNYCNTTKYSIRIPNPDNIQVVMEILRRLTDDFDYITTQNSIYIIPIKIE